MWLAVSIFSILEFLILFCIHKDASEGVSLSLQPEIIKVGIFTFGTNVLKSVDLKRFKAGINSL